MTDTRPFEGSAFEDNRLRIGCDFRVIAAHDAGDAARLRRVGNDQHVAAELAVDAVKGLHIFAFLGPPCDEVMVDNVVVVICMQGYAQLDHDVVRHVDDVVDRTNAGLAQALLHP